MSGCGLGWGCHAW